MDLFLEWTRLTSIDSVEFWECDLPVEGMKCCCQTLYLFIHLLCPGRAVLIQWSPSPKAGGKTSHIQGRHCEVYLLYWQKEDPIFMSNSGLLDDSEDAWSTQSTHYSCVTFIAYKMHGRRWYMCQRLCALATEWHSFLSSLPLLVQSRSHSPKGHISQLLQST